PPPPVSPPPPPPATLPSGTHSLFSDNPTPAVANTNDAQAVTLGVKFQAGVDGTITGVRFYKGAQNTGTHDADLWSSTRTLLAHPTFSGETGSGWETALFSSPVAIKAGTTYIASYHTNVGFYSDNDGFFANGYSHDGLTAPANAGVYAYGSDQ